MINWSWKQFSALSTAQLFDILELRQRVFVVEQECAYPDIDELDKRAWHLSGYDNGHRLMAYLRMLPVETEKPFSSLGRIVTAPKIRNEGVGKRLINLGIEFAQTEHPNHPIRISAQVHLEKYYTEFGFSKSSEPYDEDGITVSFEFLEDE